MIKQNGKEYLLVNFMKTKKIKDAVLAITYRCNSRCRMCNIWKNNNHSNELTPEDYMKLPSGLSDINITGGEPFLKNDLYEIVKTIKQKCVNANIIISSNGFEPELIVFAMKKILKLDSKIGVAISIDGIGQKHDDIRGFKNGYKKATFTIKQLKNIGVKNLKIAFTIGDYNANQLEKVYKLSKELEVDFTLSAVHSSEIFFGKQSKIIKNSEIIKQLDWLIKHELKTWNYKKLARAYFAYGLKEFIKTGKRILPDYSGKLNFFITPQGCIYPSDISSHKIGNLKNINEKNQRNALKKFEQSWMICTARQTMKKHWIQVGWWVLKNKF